MKYYLEHEYLKTLRGEQEPSEYVGPFRSRWGAHVHRRHFGPVEAKIVKLDEQPVWPRLMEPGEHAIYVQNRY